jgi:hypothetical protein
MFFKVNDVSDKEINQTTSDVETIGQMQVAEPTTGTRISEDAGNGVRICKQIGEDGQKIVKEVESVSNPSNTSMDSLSNTPMIPESVYQNLPNFFKGAIENYKANSRERDVFLTGLLGALSGCLFNASGLYRSRKVYSTLNCFISAPPASGKGALVDAKYVIYPLHELLAKPAFGTPIRLIIPGDISGAKLLELLHTNNGWGVMVEAEADSLGNSTKQDWGKAVSQILRYNFHHEPLSYARKQNDENIEIKEPRMAIALAGTPKQILSIIPNIENGLFSRFMFYTYETTSGWENFDQDDDQDLRSLLTRYGSKLVDLHNYYENNACTFTLSKEQWRKFNATFEQHYAQSTESHGQDIVSTVKRMGLITFRLAMILSAFTRWENDNKEERLCMYDRDFETAMALGDIFLKHVKVVLNTMPEVNLYNLKENKQRFIQSLPNEFERKEVLGLAKDAEISLRTMDRILKDLVMSKKYKSVNGRYVKI